MAPLHLHRLYCSLLAAGLLLTACEPITVRVLPGGGVIVEEPEDPGETGGPGADAGAGEPVDAGTEPDAGPGDGGTSGWSACADGWQRREVQPLGERGDPRFGLDSQGTAYFTEFTDTRFKVVSTAEGVPPSDTGHVGIPWQSRLLVDGQGAVHLGISPTVASGDTEPPPVYHLSNAGGQWTRTEVARGQIADASLDAQGFVHLLVISPEVSHGLLHVHNRSGTWVVDSTGTGLGSAPTAYVHLRVDASGHAHIAYRGQSQANPGIWYLTNATGTWVKERVTPQVGNTSLELGPTGAPHVFWTTAEGVVQRAVRGAGGGWNVSMAVGDTSVDASVAIDAQGGVHLLTPNNSGLGVDYHRMDPASGTWSRTRLATLSDPTNDFLGEMFLTLDGQGLAHAMYRVMWRNQSAGRVVGRIEYARQCP